MFHLRYRLTTGETAAVHPDDEPTTQELKAVQAARADTEEQRAAIADQPDEARAAKRRADKAAYLRDRLAEAENAESDDE